MMMRRVLSRENKMEQKEEEQGEEGQAEVGANDEAEGGGHKREGGVEAME